MGQSELIADAVRKEHIDAVVSSGLQRAEAAAALVRQGRENLSRLDDSRFLELNRGDWAGRRLEDLRREDPEGYRAWAESRGATRAPGGESPGDVARRTIPAFQDWAQRYAGGCVMIVAHLWVLRSAAAEALGLPMERSPQLALPPGGMIEMEWPVEPGAAPKLVRFGLERADSGA